MLAFPFILFVCCCFPVIHAYWIISSSHNILKNHHGYRTYHATPLHRPQHQQTLALSSTKPHSANQDWSINAIEEARDQFEHLIGPLLFDDNESHSILTQDHKKKPHLLTNAGRKRREIEIRLLQSLKYSDDAIDELMSLWIYECPNQIVNIDILQFMSSKDSSCTVQEAAMILRNIIHECPITVWSEPGARLAYILFLQEQFEECEECVQSVLSVKPWHFEMIQLQILLELTYRHNMARAIQIARQHGLPPLHHIKHRHRWVQQATQQAQERLQQLESYTATELHHSPWDGDSVHDSNSTLTSLTATTIATSFTSPSWQ